MVAKENQKAMSSEAKYVSVTIFKLMLQIRGHGMNNQVRSVIPSI